MWCQVASSFLLSSAYSYGHELVHLCPGNPELQQDRLTHAVPMALCRLHLFYTICLLVPGAWVWGYVNESAILGAPGLLNKYPQYLPTEQ